MLAKEKELTAAEREKQLRAEDKKLQADMLAKEKEALLAARNVDDMGDRQQATQEETSTAVTSTTNEAKWEETARAKSEIGATQQETQEMHSMMTHAEVVVDMLDQVKRKANGLIAHQEAGWREQLGMAKHDVTGATSDEMKVLTKSAAASENQTVDLARALGTKIRDVSGQTESLAKEMTESVNTTSTWLRGMMDESQSENKAAKKGLMNDIDHEMTKLVDAEVDFSGQMHQVAQWLLKKSGGSVKRGQDIETSLAKLLAMSEKVKRGQDIETSLAKLL